MKTKLLLLFLCLAVLDLQAQIPAAPAQDAAAAAREQLLRDALRRSGTVITGNSTNVTVTTVPLESQPAANNVPTGAASTNSAESVAGAVANETETPSQVVAGSKLVIMGNPTPKAEPPDMETLIPAASIRFMGTDFGEVLKIYAKFVNRTILPSPALPGNLKINLDVVQAALTKREVIQVLETIFAMNNIVLVPIGEKFVKVLPSGEAGPAGADFNIKNADQLPETGTFISYVVQLQYATPSQVQPFLTPYARFAGGIQAIDSSGILVLRDYTENVKRMLEMIKQVDVAIIPDIISEVIPIKYAKVGEIASMLNSLGGTTTAGVGASSGTRGARAGATGGRSSLTNPTGTAGGIRGTASAASGINAPAAATAGGQPSDFTSQVRAIIARASTPGSPGSGASGDIQLFGETKIIPDERSNSLLVYATRQDMEMIKSIVAKMDLVLPQVLIEAMILDVTLGDDFTLGVSAAQAPKQLDPGGIVGGGAINNGSGAVNSGLSFLNNFLSVVGTNAVPSAFPSTDGLTYITQIGPTWNVAVSALANNNKVKLLARPSIQTSHNVPANIFVGETRPYVTSSSYDYNGQPRSQYQQSQIGISLDVIPLINVDGLVVMDIQQKVSQASAKGGGVTIDGNEVPITKDESANAQVAVHSGETIVMGGFIQSVKSEGKAGIPYLQDIPFLGALFRTTTKSDARRELLVLIRPTVLPTPKVAAANTDAERDRHPAAKMAERVFKNEEDKLLKQADDAKYLEKETKAKKKNMFGTDSPVIEIP